jgi:ATP-dependent Lhr-like helicase
VADALARLVDDGTVLVVEGDRFCDAENLERLLRLQRARRRPAFEALPLARLPQFVAAHQGVGAGADLRDTLERLFGFVAPAGLWEEAILPARGPFAPAELDLLLQESDLLWFGAGKARVGFCFEDDARLFLPPCEETPALVPRGRRDFFELQRESGLDSRALTERLWELVWEGRVVNDTFVALRRGLAHGFQAAPTSRARRGFGRWQSSRPLVGTWRPLLVDPPADELDEAEDAKERARFLLARYGVLFRELCANELPALAWGRLVRTLRLLELSGEVLAGRFFEGIDGLQFATPTAFRRLRGGLDDEAVITLNACDPASLCGTGLLGLPPRVPSTWLVYEGAKLVFVARRDGRELDVHAPLQAEHLQWFDGRSVVVETIDGATAATSPHARAFLDAGFHDDRGRLIRDRAF